MSATPVGTASVSTSPAKAGAASAPANTAANARATRPATWAASRRRGIIITTAVASLVAATFYVGFIVMMVMRALH